MPRTDLPIDDTAGSAPAQAHTDHDLCHPIDWRQLSHELRTPLNAILGNVELLLDGSAGPLSMQARTCVGEVQAAGRHLLRQLQLLLAWSELRATTPQLTRSPVELLALIREALSGACADPVRIEPHDARFLIWGDPFWLQTLVAEIIALGGAACAAPTVRLENRPERRELNFAWSDSGAAQTGSLQMALIEVIAGLQGAAVALHAEGLTLHWPWQRLDRPGAAPVTQEPAPAPGARVAPS